MPKLKFSVTERLILINAPDLAVPTIRAPFSHIRAYKKFLEALPFEQEEIDAINLRRHDEIPGQVLWDGEPEPVEFEVSDVALEALKKRLSDLDAASVGNKDLLPLWERFCEDEAAPAAAQE